MGVDPKATMRALGSSTDDPATILSQWIFEAATSGYFDTLSDLRFLDQQKYLAAREILSERLADVAETYDTSQTASHEIADHAAMGADDLSLAREITKAAATGQMARLKHILVSTPHSINMQNENKDTALILAARCKKFPELDFLLNCQDIDGSICNWQRQNPLHHLAMFTEEEIKQLVPRLISSKASHDQEAASPESVYGSAFGLKPRIRADPLCQAVLENNNFLLQFLLDTIHSSTSGPTSDRLKCRVCESGSRYRKMMAMAVILHNFAAVELLQEHRRTNNAEDGAQLNEIEVWFGPELLPVWQLALQGCPASIVDLPESFYRALSHGSDCSMSLRKTLQLLWQKKSSSIPLLFHQLQQSVIDGNAETIDYIMEEGKACGFKSSWWWNTHDLAQWPVFLSIRLGFRDIFEKLWSIDPEMINRPGSEICSVPNCRSCRNPFKLPVIGRPRRKVHDINLSQLALSYAASAAHQDKFFV